MFHPETFAIAMLMTVTSTICWGSFANTFKLTKRYRFEMYYWDYAIGIVLISIILALTLGSTHPGSGESFLVNVKQAYPSNIVYAMIGGFIFNIANLLLIAGLEMAGLAVAFQPGGHKPSRPGGTTLIGNPAGRSLASGAVAP